MQVCSGRQADIRVAARALTAPQLAPRRRRDEGPAALAVQGRAVRPPLRQQQDDGGGTLGGAGHLLTARDAAPPAVCAAGGGGELGRPLRRELPRVHAVRAVSMLASGVLFFLALRHLALEERYLVFFTAPFRETRWLTPGHCNPTDGLARPVRRRAEGTVRMPLARGDARRDGLHDRGHERIVATKF
jgi:hypothetical protein